MTTGIRFERETASTAPDVERLEYTRSDGSTYHATVSRTLHRLWVATIVGPDGWPIWKPAMPFRDRSALIRRCTEEVDREARRRER